MHHSKDEEKEAFREEFKTKIDDWRPIPEGRIPVIALVCGDTLIQSPGTIHAPITLTNCMVVGGMAWRKETLSKSLEWHFLSLNPNCTNEALPQQTREIIHYLKPRVKDSPQSFGFKTENVGKFEDMCNSLSGMVISCRCSAVCSATCGCGKQGIHCGLEYHKDHAKLACNSG
jgi:hypothetical protein